MTDSFIAKVALLCKKPTDGYANCKKDISKEFKNEESINDLWIKFTEIHRDKSGSIKIVKARVNNTYSKTGKVAGYRVICIIDKEKEEVGFLSIYPKKGKYGKEKESDNDIEGFLAEYLKEYKNGTIKEVDLKNGISIIEHTTTQGATAAEAGE